MIYREDDWKAKVEVLEDNSDDKWMKYKLKVIKTIRSSRIYKTPKDGHIFEIVHLKDAGWYGGRWHLSEN